MYPAVNFLMLLGTWAVAVWVIAFGVPMLARAAFVARVSELHDDVEDAVLARRLPRNDPAVRDFLAVTRAMTLEPRSFGLSEALAVHMTHHELGHLDGCHAPTYADLEPTERKLIHESDRNLTQALRVYLLFGSRFWLLFTGFLVIRRLTYRVQRKVATNGHATPGSVPLKVSAEDLAEDIREDAKRRLPDRGLGPQAVHA